MPHKAFVFVIRLPRIFQQPGQGNLDGHLDRVERIAIATDRCFPLRKTGSKIAFLMPDSLEVRLGRQGF